MKGFIKFLLIVLGIFTGWQVAVRLARKWLHFPAPAFIGPFLDSDFRRGLQPPTLVIAWSGIRPGDRVLEVGCGSGAYTTFVARAVGPEGKVYALDTQPGMLQQLARKLTRPEHHDLRNTELIQAHAYSLPFMDNSLDLVYTIAVLQEIPDKGRALAEMRRVLRPGGILAVTEFLPDPDYSLPCTTRRLGARAGFLPERFFGNFWRIHLALSENGGKALTQRPSWRAAGSGRCPDKGYPCFDQFQHRQPSPAHLDANPSALPGMSMLGCFLMVEKGQEEVMDDEQ